jgi:hypothetical protein
MQALLASFGHLEKLARKSRVSGFLRGQGLRVDVVFISWMENQLIAKRSGRVSPWGTVKLLARTLFIKVFTRRMVLVRHNHYPHGTTAQSERLARKLVDFYEVLFFDLVFVHSGAPSALRPGGFERVYLPHPLYQWSSSPQEAVQCQGLPQRYFLAFGRIFPYKKLDELMNVFPESETLVVCGDVGDPVYAEKLAAIRRRNVLYRPGYLSDDSARTLVSGAQAVVVAHAEPNVIVSGTFFYAVSLNRPVFAVRTPFLEWLAPRLGRDVLTVGNDLVDLCRKIDNAPCTPISAQSGRDLEREFGDGAVRTALAKAFDPV